MLNKSWPKHVGGYTVFVIQ